MIAAVGSWKYQGTFYEDQLLRLIVDVPVSRSAEVFSRKYKQALKTRFEQIDIWISSHEIQMI
jgi:hypothetical protein